MDKLFFIKRFFLPVGIFSFVINILMLAPSVYMLQLQDRVVVTKSEETLWLLTLLLAVALGVMGALEVVRSHLLVKANNAIDIVFAPYLFKKMAESASNADGEQNSYLLSDLHSVRTFLTGHSIMNLFDAPWLPVYMLILYFMNPILFFVMVIGSLIMLALTIATEIVTKKSLSEASASSRMASRFVELTMRNAEVVNSMGMIDNIIKRWSSLNNRVLRLQTQAGNRSGAITGITKFMRQFIQALAMGTGTYIVLKDPTFSMGMMIAGGIIFGKALGPLEYMISGWKGMLDARDAYRRLDKFIEESRKNQVNLMELPPPTGQIVMEHVTFGIRTLNKVIIRDVSMNLAAGDVLGVIGPSASGKSTLARLLVGVWKPIQGDIRIDGSEISSWPSGRLGKYVGYLPQDIELFIGTVAENIARLEEPDSDKVIAAAQLAGLHDLILHLPNGYDTQIGDGGAFLSGGQRQRIGLARALYNNPKFVVLDEPNSSLDTEGEAALMSALDYLKKAGTTTVVITHNPNYLNKVDKLLVLQYGSLAAFGPKEWVLARLNKARQVQAEPPVTTNEPPAASGDSKVAHLVRGQ
jgi:PrtD family type I secretion system ABC transporter